MQCTSNAGTEINEQSVGVARFQIIRWVRPLKKREIRSKQIEAVAPFGEIVVDVICRKLFALQHTDSRSFSIRLGYLVQYRQQQPQNGNCF